MNNMGAHLLGYIDNLVSFYIDIAIGTVLICVWLL